MFLVKIQNLETNREFIEEVQSEEELLRLSEWLYQWDKYVVTAEEQIIVK